MRSVHQLQIRDHTERSRSVVACPTACILVTDAYRREKSGPHVQNVYTKKIQHSAQPSCSLFGICMSASPAAASASAAVAAASSSPAPSPRSPPSVNPVPAGAPLLVPPAVVTRPPGPRYLPVPSRGDVPALSVCAMSDVEAEAAAAGPAAGVEGLRLLLVPRMPPIDSSSPP